MASTKFEVELFDGKIILVFCKIISKTSWCIKDRLRHYMESQSNQTMSDNECEEIEIKAVSIIHFPLEVKYSVLNVTSFQELWKKS